VSLPASLPEDAKKSVFSPVFEGRFIGFCDQSKTYNGVLCLNFRDLSDFIPPALSRTGFRKTHALNARF